LGQELPGPILSYITPQQKTPSIIALAFLAINFLFASHNSYLEKDSIFEQKPQALFRGLRFLNVGFKFYFLGFNGIS